MAVPSRALKRGAATPPASLLGKSSPRARKGADPKCPSLPTPRLQLAGPFGTKITPKPIWPSPGCVSMRLSPPALWWIEVRNILVVNERRKRLAEADSGIFLRELARPNNVGPQAGRERSAAPG